MSRPGSILLEVLLSLALFVSGAMAIGAAVRRATDAVGLARDRAEAADLAWNAMALIESGVSTPSAVNDTAPAREDPWTVRVDTSPTEFDGLTRVEVSTWRARQGSAAGQRPVYTATRLLDLRRRTDREPDPVALPISAGVFGGGA